MIVRPGDGCRRLAGMIICILGMIGVLVASFMIVAVSVVVYLYYIIFGGNPQHLCGKLYYQ